MRHQWSTAPLLIAALAAGCSSERATEPAPAAAGADSAAPAAPDTAAPGAAVEASPTAQAPATAPAPAVQPAPARPAPAARPATPVATAPARDAQPPAPGTAARQAAAPAPAAAPGPPRPQFREVTLPAGTALPLELLTDVSTETAQVETPVRARLRQAVVVDGLTVFPSGATLTGEVAEVVRAGRVQGRSRLVLRFTDVQFGGTSERIRSNPVVFEGEATRGEDATKVGIGAGIGAAVGGILGGGSGAAKGAAIGGAAGAGAVLATRGRDVVLTSGAAVDATLATPAEVRVSVR